MDDERLRDVRETSCGEENSPLGQRCLMLVEIWRKIGLAKYDTARNCGHLDRNAAAEELRDADTYFRLAECLEDAIETAEGRGETIPDPLRSEGPRPPDDPLETNF